MDEPGFSSRDLAPSFRPARGLQSPLAIVPPGAKAPDQTQTGISGAVLEAVLNSLTDGVVVADTDGRFLLFNAAAERMLGIGARKVSPADWSATYGCYLDDGVTPYPADRLPLVRAINGETVHDCEVLIRNPHVAGDVWLSINSSPVTDDTGAVRGGVIVFRDITTKKREPELTQMLSAAVEQTADSVVVTNRDGVIEYVNPAAEAITGYSKPELIGALPRLFRSGHHSAEFYAGMWATLLRGDPFRATIVNRRKQGTLYLSEQTMTPIRDGTGAISHFVSVGKDVTELRKAAEQESKLQLARAVQQRLLPAAPPRGSGLEIAGGAVMANATGGDFYDYIALRDGRMGVVVGDVSGHAIDAALVMAHTHAYVRSIALANADPGAILSLVNRVMTSDVLDGQFVTAIFAAVDAGSGTLSYSSAGHTAGYIFDDQGRLAHTLDSTNLPLGLFPDVSYQTVDVTGLSEGSLIVLITDGVVEAENGEGVPFGEARAVDVIGACAGMRADAIVDGVQTAVREFAGGKAQDDDVTVVACRIRKQSGNG